MCARFILGLVFLSGCVLFAQQAEVTLLARPAKAVFKLGEPIEIEVACVASVANKYRDNCDSTQIAAKVGEGVRDISRDIPTQWVEFLIHSACGGIGVGRSFGCGGDYMRRFLDNTPHWSRIALPFLTHIGRAGTFNIAAEYKLPKSEGGVLPLRIETEVSVVEDQAWTRQQLADIFSKLRATPEIQQYLLLGRLRELEGEDVLHVVMDRFTNSHSPADQELELAIVNAQDQRLALQLLEERALSRDFKIDMGIIETMTAMAMRIADPEAFAAEAATWPRTRVRNKTLEANAMVYLHDAVIRLVHQSYLDLDRRIALAQILQALAQPRCDHIAGPLSPSEIAALTLELQR